MDVDVDVMVVAVAPGEAARRGHRAVLEPLGETLAAALGPKPPQRERLLLLPPLHFQEAAARSGGARGGGRRRGAQRLARAALILAAYPGVSRETLSLLAEHRPVYEAMRKEAARLGRALEATVVAGTVLLAQPRKHWEAWPDDPHVFHSAWAFGPDGEPAGSVRDPAPPRELLRRGVRPGWPTASASPPPTVLPTGRPCLHVGWGLRESATAPGPDAGVALSWLPVLERAAGDVDAVSALASQPPDVGAFVAADTRGGVVCVRRERGSGVVRRSTLQATRRRPVTWLALEALPVKGGGTRASPSR